MSYLKTQGLTMRFGGLVAVSDLNLEIEEGQIVSIIGPNGAGKTTVFNMISGFYHPSEGKVVFSDRDITGMTPNAVAGIGISRTFQAIRLYKRLTVLENVMVAQHLRMKSNVFAAMLHLPGAVREEKEMHERAQKLLEESQLWEQRDLLASSLPYGLQRRLEIVRALATNPKVLLLDEPAAGMNPKETEDLSEFIREIRERYHVTVLLIEHHMGFVMSLSDMIYVLDFGKTIARGTPEEIQNNPAVINAYLGREGEKIC